MRGKKITLYLNNFSYINPRHSKIPENNPTFHPPHRRKSSLADLVGIPM
jgi:hypothetical protein